MIDSCILIRLYMYDHLFDFSTLLTYWYAWYMHDHVFDFSTLLSLHLLELSERHYK